MKKAALKNFAIFTGKHLCWSLFLLKPEDLQLFKKEIPTQVFPVDIAKSLRLLILKNI